MSIYKHINSIEPSRNEPKQRENVRCVSSWIARELDRVPECYENVRIEIGFNRPFRNVRKWFPKVVSAGRTGGRLAKANNNLQIESLTPIANIQVSLAGKTVSLADVLRLRFARMLARWSWRLRF